MADQVTNYQCPACGGPLHFAPESGSLECEYCLSGFSLTEIETLYAEKEAKAAAAGQAAAEEQADGAGWDLSELSCDWGADADGMRAYSCPSCGAELICEASTAATACPYCGNPITTACLPGFLADKFDVSAAGSIPMRITAAAADAAENSNMLVICKEERYAMKTVKIR